MNIKNILILVIDFVWKDIKWLSTIIFKTTKLVFLGDEKHVGLFTYGLILCSTSYVIGFIYLIIEGKRNEWFPFFDVLGKGVFSLFIVFVIIVIGILIKFSFDILKFSFETFVINYRKKIR